MCGIVGYVGKRNALEVLLNGLQKLEYRGYDSAGVAVFTEVGLQIRKSKGRLASLESKLREQPLQGNIGMGHTRWATHGKPSDVNSHPHTDNSSKFSVVHNGIIENYSTLKEELVRQGHIFVSETDTEVISHLIASLYVGDIVKTVQQAVKRMKGAFALGVLTEYEPDKLVAVRMASPLIVGIGEGENFIGSDIPALLEHTRDIYVLHDGEMAVLTDRAVELMTVEGQSIARDVLHVDWDIDTAEKAGFDHFMLKEIFEQPEAYSKTMRARLDSSGTEVTLSEIGVGPEELRQIDRVHIIGCGTAYHAGVVGKKLIERIAGYPVELDIASEYRYRAPIVTRTTLVIVVSQSGETADTLAAMREARARGARVLAITNVIGSSIAREADDVLLTCAGPEIAVASTKAYTTQVIAFALLAIHMGQAVNRLEKCERMAWIDALLKLPKQAEQILQQANSFKQMAEQLATHPNLFFIGRGIDYAAVLEGSLKLKEISYIHSEALAAGELKHGTLALVEDGFPIVALLTQGDVAEKTISNMKEVKARGAYVFAIASENIPPLDHVADQCTFIPATADLLSPALSVIPLQLIAYYASLARGNDVDKPRNLAKSVTVE
ncbi:glutamine--fructose-6-phosphate transaminase (isomerizing) [Xylanibacillus composti]|uniref:Glutamine--fructose-6-phosphate aminotransferase [isomerizing] n=1 Tax=Xylanibacillus composti TaxID=1572762 RepID=A0A8J4H2J6_9BACL|nr:glutamine--fructose-6-phosphate transaminase (isomerizing) [Xylanibacillus composti]MDT9724499.1 glutamine--fructose-6-phosphate transaminase (isomerizing) [Xylanibacillus composti]GIQ69763.1 glutamine--fructose-6-phosphate aminotransferase [isomerizing] [Xylanibacillus composti]